MTHSMQPPSSAPPTASAVEDKLPYRFARLTPRNAKACKAFSSVIDAISKEPDRFAYQRQFLDYDASPVSLQSLLQRGHTPGATSGTGTDTEPEGSPSPDDTDHVFSGSYVFSLETELRQALRGWRAGNGRWTEPSGDVELLLSYRMPSTGVRGLHTRFEYDRKHGIFRLQAVHRNTGVTLGTKHFVAHQGPLSLRSTTIQIGDLLYDFAFTVSTHEEAAFQALKTDYFSEYLGAPPPIEATSATPSENDMTVGSWTLHRAVGMGAYGVVSAASRRDAPVEVVALKQFLRQNRHSAATVAREVRSAQAIKSAIDGHDYMNHILHLKEVIYQRGKEDFDAGPPEYVWLLYTPLTRGTFLSHILTDKINIPSVNLRKSLFTQVLKGLVCLHSTGWVHRDIKPANLGVVSLEPPRAVILDLGQAYHFPVPHDYDSDDLSNGVGIPPEPGHVGTRGYIAPEMEVKPYSTAVDIWAAGLVAHEVFLGSHPFRSISRNGNPWRKHQASEQINQNMLAYKAAVVNSLFEEPTESINYLIGTMLHWSPTVRCKAEYALNHVSLAEAARSGEQTDPLPGNKRRLEEDDA